MHKKSYWEFKRTLARKLGDSSLFIGMRTSKVWGLLLNDSNRALDLIAKQFIQANASIFAYLFTCIKGGQHGVNVTGLCLTVIGSCYISVFNHESVWAIFTPFVAFAVPFIIAFAGWGWQEVCDALFVDVHSLPLAIFNCVFVLSSLTHTVMSWCGLNKELNRRGKSYLYILTCSLFEKYVTVGEFFINFIECLAVISLGICLIYFDIDHCFGWFLLTIAGNELIIITNDKTTQLHDGSILGI